MSEQIADKSPKVANSVPKKPKPSRKYRNKVVNIKRLHKEMMQLMRSQAHKLIDIDRGLTVGGLLNKHQADSMLKYIELLEDKIALLEINQMEKNGKTHKAST